MLMLELSKARIKALVGFGLVVEKDDAVYSTFINIPRLRDPWKEKSFLDNAGRDVVESDSKHSTPSYALSF